MRAGRVKNSGFNERLYAVVVGNCTDEFTSSAAELLDSYAIEFILCPDIYSAAGRLAKDQISRNILVIGHIRDLSKEKGRFLQKISEKGLYCCCLAENGWPQGYKYPRQLLSGLTQGSVFVINDFEDIRQIITGLSANKKAVTNVLKGKNDFSGFNGEQFRATKAELEALLGGQ